MSDGVVGVRSQDAVTKVRRNRTLHAFVDREVIRSIDVLICIRLSSGSDTLRGHRARIAGQSARAAFWRSAADATRTLWGTGAGPSGSFGTVMLSILPDSRATGTLYLSAGVFSLIGRLDATAGGSLTGTIQGSTATGAFLTANGSAATFSANPGVCH